MKALPASRPLDDLDRRIIEALRRNPQKTNAALAIKFGVAKTTIGLRIDRLSETGALRIAGTADPGKLGFRHTAWLSIQVQGRRVADVGQDIARIPEVLALTSQIGRYQLFVSLIARDLPHLVALLEDKIGPIKGIGAFDTHLFLDTLLALPDLKALRGAQPTIAERIAEIGAFDRDGRLDELDRAILAEFQQDGRLTYRELARRRGIPESTIRARVKRLESDGLLTFVAVADPASIGLELVALLYVKVEHRRSRFVAGELARLKECWVVARTLGQYEVVAAVAVPSRDDLAALTYERIVAIEGIEHMEVHETLESFKHSLGWSRRIPRPR